MPDTPPLPKTTYPGGYPAMLALWQKRRRPLEYDAAEALPPLDVALAPLLATRVPEPQPALPGASLFAHKRLELARQFVGRTDLALLNALLIANLRKRNWPGHAPALFRRIWAEQGAALIAELEGRWLISSVITFSDHGATEAQRRTGHAFNILFSLMKLYEYERLYSRQPPQVPFQTARRSLAALPMGMEPFSIAHGGLDVNLLAPIWTDAQSDPVVAPLARHLLLRLDADPGTLFRRIRMMREEKLGAKARKRAKRAVSPG